MQNSKTVLAALRSAGFSKVEAKQAYTEGIRDGLTDEQMTQVVNEIFGDDSAASVADDGNGDLS